MRRNTTLAVLTVALSVAVTVAVYPDLPAEMAIHWDASGTADDTTSRPIAAFLLPAITAGLLVLFGVIPRIDPLGENVAAFREYYDGFVVALLLFMLYVQGLVLAANLPWVGEFEMTRAILPATGVLFYAAGVVMERAERNWFVGIRTPWTLSSDEVWERTHKLGGRLFKLAGIVAVLGVLAGEYAIYFVVVPAVAVSIVATVYSYYVYQQVDESASAVGP